MGILWIIYDDVITWWCYYIDDVIIHHFYTLWCSWAHVSGYYGKFTSKSWGARLAVQPWFFKPQCHSFVFGLFNQLIRKEMFNQKSNLLGRIQDSWATNMAIEATNMVVCSNQMVVENTRKTTNSKKKKKKGASQLYYYIMAVILEFWHVAESLCPTTIGECVTVRVIERIVPSLILATWLHLANKSQNMQWHHVWMILQTCV